MESDDYPVGNAAFAPSDDGTAALVGSESWTGTTGRSVSVPYSFSVSVQGGSLFGSAARSAALSAMQLYSNVANVTFSETSASLADLTFSQDDLGSGVLGLTVSYFSGTTLASAEVQLDDRYSDFSAGTEAYLTLLHELGHALGLKHPGNYSGSEDGPFLPASEDSNDTTVMSYNEGTYASGSRPARTPMFYDIQAMQFLYGANTTYNSGDTAYSYDGTSMALTLWDGAGQDQISAQSYTSGGVTIDLREGIDYLTSIGSTYLWVAEGANIEKGEGSGNGDTLRGNTLANTLFGMSGADTVYGGDAADTVYGGAGVADPNDGNDTLYGEAGSDLLYGNGGADSLFGGGSSVDPNDAADLVNGGRGNDYILGNGGGDTLYGAEDNDTLHAGVGDDVYAFLSDSGDDVILLFENPGATAGDAIQIAANINGTGIADASDLLSRITYSGGDAVIDLGSGNTITIDSVSANTLTADDFSVA
jgi:serralysin